MKSLIFLLLFILFRREYAFKISFSNSKINTENKNIFIHFFEKNLKMIKSLSITAGTAAVIFSNQPDALALSSGSRSGGSSFRSSSQSFNSPRYNTRSYSTKMTSPLYIPYGYGVSPFNFIPINIDVIVFGVVGYVVLQFLSNRISGYSDFSYDKESDSLGSGVSVIKLQIAIDTDWSQEGNIIENLNAIAAKTNTFDKRSDIADLLSKASLIILRKSSDWNSVAYESETFDTRKDKKGELYFQKLVVRERGKYDREIIPSLIEDNSSYFCNQTQVVVSLIVAIKGQSDAYQKKTITSISELRSCLQSLAYEAFSDSGENIMAVELLWTPSERGTVVSDRDLIQDYPELMKL